MLHRLLDTSTAPVALTDTLDGPTLLHANTRPLPFAVAHAASASQVLEVGGGGGFAPLAETVNVQVVVQPGGGGGMPPPIWGAGGLGDWLPGLK